MYVVFRMTLLLGPPSSGKSTLMRALTGKLDKRLKVLTRLVFISYAFLPDAYQKSPFYGYRRYLATSHIVAIHFPSSTPRGPAHMLVSTISIMQR